MCGFDKILQKVCIDWRKNRHGISCNQRLIPHIWSHSFVFGMETGNGLNSKVLSVLWLWEWGYLWTLEPMWSWCLSCFVILTFTVQLIGYKNDTGCKKWDYRGIREAIIREKKIFLGNHFIKWWPPPRPPFMKSLFIYFFSDHFLSEKRDAFEGCLKGVDGCFKGVWRVLQGVWSVFEGCLEK